MEKWNIKPPESDQKYVFEQCKKWGMVWGGDHKGAVHQPDEMEMLGLPTNYMKGGH